MTQSTPARFRSGDAGRGRRLDRFRHDLTSVMNGGSVAAIMHGAFLQNLIVVLDWIGTLAFALSGALLGVQKKFDLFGVLFLSFVVPMALDADRFAT